MTESEKILARAMLRAVGYDRPELGDRQWPAPRDIEWLVDGAASLDAIKRDCLRFRRARPVWEANELRGGPL